MEMNQETIYTIILAALMLVGIVLTFIIKPTKNPEKLRGRIVKTLARFAAPRKCRVLHNLTIQGKKGSCTVDHAVVGWFGVLFVNDLLLDGDYYGTLLEGDWICSKTNRQDDSVTRVGSVKNPLTAAREFEAAARALLTANKVRCAAMESIVVSAHKKSDFVITGSKDCAFNLRGLRRYLSSAAWLQKDVNADIDRICEVLTKQA